MFLSPTCRRQRLANREQPMQDAGEDDALDGKLALAAFKRGFRDSHLTANR